MSEKELIQKFIENQISENESIDLFHELNSNCDLKKMTLTGYIWRDWSMAIKINCIPMMITALYPVFLPESPSKDLQSFFL